MDDSLKDLFGSGKQANQQEQQSDSESDHENLKAESTTKSTDESFSLLSLFGQVEDTPNSKSSLFYTCNPKEIF